MMMCSQQPRCANVPISSQISRRKAYLELTTRRFDSQAATCQGTNKGLSSRLTQQRKLRHQLRSLPPPVPAHKVRTAQRAESSGAESSSSSSKDRGRWALSALWAVVVVSGRISAPQMTPAVLSPAAAHRSVAEK